MTINRRDAMKLAAAGGLSAGTVLAAGTTTDFPFTRCFASLREVTVTLEEAVPLFADVPAEIRVWASHGDFVAAAPSGFSVVATSANAPVAAMADANRRLYALLFHPEVVHTDHGLEILRTWLATAFGGGRRGRRVAKIDAPEPA